MEYTKWERKARKLFTHFCRSMLPNFDRDTLEIRIVETRLTAYMVKGYIAETRFSPKKYSGCRPDRKVAGKFSLLMITFTTGIPSVSSD